MKKIKIISIVTLILAIIMSDIIFCNQQNNSFCYADSTYSEIVMERNSKRVLHANSERVKRPMASTTKILTAICAIENCNTDEIVEISPEAEGVEGSSIYLKQGEKLKLIDLLYGLMLRSGNDAAVQIALHVGGSIEKFAELMNNTAKKIGAVDSNFVNPHGLSAKNHYTTCYDLALITCHALGNETFSKIVSTRKYSCKNSDGYLRVMYNKNKMLSDFDGADGVKTGFTKEAGRCLVSSATRNGMQLVSVVLNCGPMFERSREILNDCFSSYSLEKIVKSGEELGKVNVTLRNVFDCPIGFTVKKDVVLPLTEKEKGRLRIESDVPENVDFPFSDDRNLGTLNVYVQNNLIYSDKLYIISLKNTYTFGEAFKAVAVNWYLL